MRRQGLLIFIMSLFVVSCSARAAPKRNFLDFRTDMPFGKEGLITIRPPMKFECGIYEYNHSCDLVFRLENGEAKQIRVSVFDVEGREVRGVAINSSYSDSNPDYGNIEFTTNPKAEIERIELRGPSSAVLSLFQFINHAPPTNSKSR